MSPLGALEIGEPRHRPAEADHPLDDPPLRPIHRISGNGGAPITEAALCGRDLFPRKKGKKGRQRFFLADPAAIRWGLRYIL